MALWVRFQKRGEIGFGTLKGDFVEVHNGNLFESPRPTGEKVPLGELRLLRPAEPGKLIGLAYNFRAALTAQGLAPPVAPLWFLKAPTSYLDPGAPIRLPAKELGKFIYEGELGLVIGREAREVSEVLAERCIFGFTCVNDVTAVDLITSDPQYAQWSRAKSFDTFGPFGPAVATDLDPGTLVVRTLINGKVRQEYPVSDAVFSPREIVARLSRDMTLLPGDVVACGTSVGIGVLRPGIAVEVSIEGIGKLVNPVEGPGAAA